MPLFSLKGKTAIISGAGAGIGLAVARGFAEAGANVVIWYYSNKKALTRAEEIEKEFGRAPKKVLNEARPLDLDLLAFGNEARATPSLTLPHPRAHLRRFVMEPLAEIAPELILPGQKATVADLLRGLTSAEVVRKLG